MTGINLMAVVVAVLAAFVMSTAWHIVFATQRQQLSRAAVADMKRPHLRVAHRLAVLRRVLEKKLTAGFGVL